MKKVYLIGSLRNSQIPEIGNIIRSAGFEVFDDWHAGGPEADDEWKRYEQQIGRSYLEALEGHNAWHIFNYDKSHLDTSDYAILALPAGKSGHLELGYFIGTGKPGYILLPEDWDDRFDVMYRFADGVSYNPEEIIEWLLN